MTPNDDAFDDETDDRRREERADRDDQREFFEVGGGREHGGARDEGERGARDEREPAAEGDRGDRESREDRGERNEREEREDRGARDDAAPAPPAEGEARPGDRGGRPRDDQRRDRRDRRHRRDRDRRGGSGEAHRDQNRDAGREPRREENRDTNREGAREPAREGNRDGNREGNRDGNREGNRDANAGGHREGGRDRRDGGRRDGNRDRDGRRDGGRRDDGGSRRHGEQHRGDSARGEQNRSDAGRGEAARAEAGRGERHDRGDDRPTESDLARGAEHGEEFLRHDGDGGEHGRGGPGIVRDVTRAGRHEPTPDELMPDDEPRPVAEPDEEPEGKPWELLDSEFGEGEDRGAGGGGGRRRRRDRFDRGRREVEELGAGTSGIDVLDPPRDDRERRRRGVEPGLTLRDLIPFLRPPRHVVVAGCGTGAGHARVAHALVEAMKAADRNAVLREVDLLDLLSPEYRAGYVRSVLEELSRRPALYGKPFETGAPSTFDQLPEDLDPFLLEAFGDKFRAVFMEKRPDVVVLTHWLPLKKFEADAAAGLTVPRLVVAAGEPDYHRYWYSPVVKQYLVANADFERRLLAAGAPAGSVQVVGTPVGAAFGEEVDRDAVRREHGLRRDAVTVLFRPGGAGASERVLALCERALATAGPLNLLVAAGKNERLREDLERLAVPEGSVLRAFGFVDKIHELMAVSDLLVTRATAHTAAEAAAVALPMLLLRPTPGAEERLADRLLFSGAALIARDDEQFEAELVDLCKNRRRLQALRDRARQAERPDVSGRAAERLLRILR